MRYRASAMPGSRMPLVCKTSKMACASCDFTVDRRMCELIQQRSGRRLAGRHRRLLGLPQMRTSLVMVFRHFGQPHVQDRTSWQVVPTRRAAAIPSRSPQGACRHEVRVRSKSFFKRSSLEPIRHQRDSKPWGTRSHPHRASVPIGAGTDTPIACRSDPRRSAISSDLPQPVPAPIKDASNGMRQCGSPPTSAGVLPSNAFKGMCGQLFVGRSLLSLADDPHPHGGLRLVREITGRTCSSAENRRRYGRSLHAPPSVSRLPQVSAS